jgi:transcriptional regulator with XRE-family HTH domain
MHKGRYDFKAIGQAIKEARESRGWTRERLAQEVDLAPRYIMSLENKGQQPDNHSAFISTLGPMALSSLPLGRFALSFDFPLRWHFRKC